MAGEIKMTKTIRLTKGVLKHDFIPAPLSLTMTGTLIYDVTSSIATTEETLGPVFGDIGTEGWVCLYNMDTTNFVSVGFATGVYGIKLYGAGAPADFFIIPGATIYIKADTAACSVRCIVYEF